MKSVVTLREFQYPDDYPSVRQLWESIEKGIHLGRSDTLDEIGKKIQRDPDLFLIAEDSGRVVGAVMGGFDGRRGFIYHLAVSAAFQSRGIGSLLMREVERRLQTRGCLKCYLLITVDNRDIAGFYERHG